MLSGPLCLSAAFMVGTAMNVLAVMLPSGRAEHAGAAASFCVLTLTSLPLALPFVFADAPFLTALVAQGLIVETWRVAEIWRTPSRYPRPERVLRILLLPYEFTFLERVRPRLPIRELLVSTLLIGIGCVGIMFAAGLSPRVPPYALRGWPRWLGATVAVYIVMEGATLQMVSAPLLLGWYHRPYQRHPILSRTLAEFWGVRWSSVVHKYLRSNVYEPLARRGAPRAGIGAAFLVSALLHAYIVWPAAGILPALWMLAFFLAHGGGMVLESWLRVRRWGRVGGRIFVVGFFLATIPLFMEPILRACGL